jgi:hypothetical protein
VPVPPKPSLYLAGTSTPLLCCPTQTFTTMSFFAKIIVYSAAALTTVATASTPTDSVDLTSVLSEALSGGGSAPAPPSVQSWQAFRGSFGADDQCSRCLVHNCCSDGLKCKADGHDGACTSCTGQYESPCGDKCCNSGEECHGNFCTIPF